MIRPRSIKRKLQSWVVIIFLLTGTAGWMGIWGLLYISNTTQAASAQVVERMRVLVDVEAQLTAARRLEKDWLLEADPILRNALGAKVEVAVDGIGATLAQIGAAPEADALRAAQRRLAQALPAVADGFDGGATFAELRVGAYGAYDEAMTQVESESRAFADGAFDRAKGETSRVFSWIWLLQAALFITVLLCQVFSSWAGWQLSRSISASLTGLKDNADRISMGDLKNEVAVASSDEEIVLVGEALDRLRVSLGKAMDRLTRRAPAPAKPA